jgi:hypothetical protein
LFRSESKKNETLIVGDLFSYQTMNHIEIHKRIDGNTAKIESLRKQIKLLESEQIENGKMLINERVREFIMKYGVHCEPIYNDYVKKVNKYSSDEIIIGYRMWVPDICKTWERTRHNRIVCPEHYKDLQPHQIERDAFIVYHGEDMVIPTETHLERWGN